MRSFADIVIIITDNLIPYPNTPISIPQNQVDYVVEVDAIGDPDGISKGAARITTNLNKIVTASPHYNEMFSFQSGTGGATLAVARFLLKSMH